MSAGHTPLPWRLAENDRSIVVTDALDEQGNCHVVADVLTAVGQATDTDLTNAAFIVQACNSHYELIEALHTLASLAKGVVGQAYIDDALDVLTKARGQSTIGGGEG